MASATAKKISPLLAKFQGALVGAVIGDCLGALFELSPTVSLESVLEIIDGVTEKCKNGT